jgi:hypothetical protein
VTVLLFSYVLAVASFHCIVIDDTVLSHSQLNATLAVVPLSDNTSLEVTLTIDGFVILGFVYAKSQTAYRVIAALAV